MEKHSSLRLIPIPASIIPAQRNYWGVSIITGLVSSFLTTTGHASYQSLIIQPCKSNYTRYECIRNECKQHILWKSGSINDVDLPVYTSVVSHTYPHETPRLTRTRLFGGVVQPNSPNAYPSLVTANIFNTD